jgi:ribosomal protein L4
MTFARPRDFQASPASNGCRGTGGPGEAAERVVVVEGLSFEKPRTKDFVAVLKNLKIDRSCLVAVPEYNENVYKSVRNVPKVHVMPVADLNAADIINHRRMLFTKDALTSFLDRKAGGPQNVTA